MTERWYDIHVYKGFIQTNSMEILLLNNLFCTNVWFKICKWFLQLKLRLTFFIQYTILEIVQRLLKIFQLNIKKIIRKKIKKQDYQWISKKLDAQCKSSYISKNVTWKHCYVSKIKSKFWKCLAFTRNRKIFILLNCLKNSIIETK